MSSSDVGASNLWAVLAKDLYLRYRRRWIDQKGQHKLLPEQRVGFVVQLLARVEKAD